MILPVSSVTSCRQIGLRLAQRVAELADGFAANRAGRGAPFQKCFLRARDRRVRNPRRTQSERCASNFPSIGEIFSIDRAAAAPFAVKDAGVFLSETEFLEDCLHTNDSAMHSSIARFKLARGVTPTCASAGIARAECHRFVHDFRGDIERGTETNRALARFQDEHAAIEQTLPEFVARSRRRADRRR